jgi:hypothetical protein
MHRIASDTVSNNMSLLPHRKADSLTMVWDFQNRLLAMAAMPSRPGQTLKLIKDLRAPSQLSKTQWLLCLGTGHR